MERCIHTLASRENGELFLIIFSARFAALGEIIFQKMNRSVLMNDVLFAFLLTLIAGLATGIGGLVVLFAKVTNKKFLSACLSFSAGVMIYISFAEIFLEAFGSLEYAFGDGMGYLILTVSFLPEFQ